MTVIYKANDGKEFNNEIDCINYECKVKLGNSRFYDYNNNDITDKVFEEETYFKVNKIVVDNDVSAEAIRELGKDFGFCNYSDIISAGIWIWNYNTNLFEKQID